MLDQIKTISNDVVAKHNKILCSVEKVKEYGVDIIRVTIDDPNTLAIDIDEVAEINKELLDLVNDLIPDGYYLEVSTLGIERELKTDSDLEKAIGEYIFIKTYEKIEPIKDKEIYGYLKAYDEESITVDAVIKTRRKEIKIEKAKIAKLRLAVKF